MDQDLERQSRIDLPFRKRKTATRLTPKIKQKIQELKTMALAEPVEFGRPGSVKWMTSLVTHIDDDTVTTHDVRRWAERHPWIVDEQVTSVPSSPKKRPRRHRSPSQPRRKKRASRRFVMDNEAGQVKTESAEETLDEDPNLDADIEHELNTSAEIDEDDLDEYFDDNDSDQQQPLDLCIRERDLNEAEDVGDGDEDENEDMELESNSSIRRLTFNVAGRELETFLPEAESNELQTQYESMQESEQIDLHGEQSSAGSLASLRKKKKKAKGKSKHTKKRRAERSPSPSQEAHGQDPMYSETIRSRPSAFRQISARKVRPATPNEASDHRSSASTELAVASAASSSESESDSSAMEASGNQEADPESPDSANAIATSDFDEYIQDYMRRNPINWPQQYPGPSYQFGHGHERMMEYFYASELARMGQLEQNYIGLGKQKQDGPSSARPIPGNPAALLPYDHFFRRWTLDESVVTQSVIENLASLKASLINLPDSSSLFEPFNMFIQAFASYHGRRVLLRQPVPMPPQ